ncbi:hypothetical protein TPELB_21030 [Terrisporobacter petrolearius]|uniref:Uncharacterized protein n=1 Tax=Terrisporobacter petrolearius TaxID=1460447 RepID=A0ABZ3FD95_9FIRM
MKENNSKFEGSIENIKGIFTKPVLDIIKTKIENKETIEPILKVVIPDEFVNQFKDGTVKLMENKNGEMLPNIVGANNKIIKQVRIEEVQEQLNSNTIRKLGEYSIERKLDSIQEQLDYIVSVLEDIEKSQKNAKYAKIDGAIKDIKDSVVEDTDSYRESLQSRAQSKLNEGIESIKKDIYDNIEFFKSWEHRNFFEKNIIATKFTNKNIKRKLDNLSKDYYYIKKARVALAELKLSQGMNWEKIGLIIEDLEPINKKLERVDIIGWLPPMNKKNEWQYNLFNINKQKSQIVLEFNTKELLVGGNMNEQM